MRTHLGTIQMGVTFFNSQNRWLGHILLGEARPSPEGEKRNLVAVIECEG